MADVTILHNPNCSTSRHAMDEAADAGADVEDGQAGRVGRERVGERAGRGVRAMTPVLANLTARELLVELVVVAAGAAGIGHRGSLPQGAARAQARTSWRMNAM